jgi:hypothetical protein
LNVEIKLDNGEKLEFIWRGNGQLFVAVVGEASGSWDDTTRQYPVRASTTLRGTGLPDFLASFVQPLMRRALAVAVEYPQEKAVHKK